jgi:hypothetical protein
MSHRSQEASLTEMAVRLRSIAQGAGRLPGAIRMRAQACAGPNSSMTSLALSVAPVATPGALRRSRDQWAIASAARIEQPPLRVPEALLEQLREAQVRT